MVLSAWTSGVGLAEVVQFAASIAPNPHSEFEPVPLLVEYDVGENPLRDGVLAEPLQLENGKFRVGDAPGLGIALNEDLIRRYAIG